MKKRSYKLSLPRWALAQRESWYAELAARGLRVQKAGARVLPRLRPRACATASRSVPMRAACPRARRNFMKNAAGSMC